MIDENGSQLGVLETRDAIIKAREAGLDLVLVSPDANPPVARIADLGKIKYEQSKKEKEARKSQRGGSLKEIKLSPKIAQHDFDVREKKTREFLEKKHKIKISMFFRGRENAHIDIGMKVMMRMLENLKDLGKPEGPPKKFGKNLIVILSPISK